MCKHTFATCAATAMDGSQPASSESACENQCSSPSVSSPWPKGATFQRRRLHCQGRRRCSSCRCRRRRRRRSCRRKNRVQSTAACRSTLAPFPARSLAERSVVRIGPRQRQQIRRRTRVWVCCRHTCGNTGEQTSDERRELIKGALVHGAATQRFDNPTSSGAYERSEVVP